MTDFDKIERQVNTGIKFGIAWFAFCAVAGIGTLVTLGCVAWHFLAKIW